MSALERIATIRAAAARRPPNELVASVRDATSTNRTLVVLMVEDDDDIRIPCAEFLRRAGIVVFEAIDGAAALRLLNDGLAPSIIVLDLIMPNLNGWEFRRQQIRDSQLARVPVLVMSGAYQFNLDPAMRGISGYLRKPTRLDVLLAAVKAHAI